MIIKIRAIHEEKSINNRKYLYNNNDQYLFLQKQNKIKTVFVSTEIICKNENFKRFTFGLLADYHQTSNQHYLQINFLHVICAFN